MNTFEVLDKSPGTLANRLANIVALKNGAPPTGNDFVKKNFKKKLEGLLLNGTPLDGADMHEVERVIKSNTGTEEIAEINQTLFALFLHKQKKGDKKFVTESKEALDAYLQGGLERSSGLCALSASIRQFAGKEEEPLHFHPEEILLHLKNKQNIALNKQNCAFFHHACITDRAKKIHQCGAPESETWLMYDAEHALVGGWDESTQEVIGDKVIAGVIPDPEKKPFFAGHHTVPCIDQAGKTCLIEFEERGLYPLIRQHPGVAETYIQIIPASRIQEHGSAGGVEYYVYDGTRVITSHGASFSSSQLLENFETEDDIVFVVYSSSGSFREYYLHSMVTGTGLMFHERDLLSHGPAKGEDDYEYIFRQRQHFGGTIHGENGASAEWRMGNFFGGTPRISLKGLIKIWKKANEKVKNMKNISQLYEG